MAFFQITVIQCQRTIVWCGGTLETLDAGSDDSSDEENEDENQNSQEVDTDTEAKYSRDRITNLFPYFGHFKLLLRMIS